MFKFEVLVALCIGTVVCLDDIHDRFVLGPSKTLRQVHIIFRHGDRTPDAGTGFPSDIHQNETYHPYGRGELTLKGKQNAYDLGDILRTRYGSFLGNVYYNNLLSAYSSNYGRCQETLQAVLANLFPPTTEWKITDSLNWQPIHYTIPTPDNLISLHRICPKVLQVTTEMDEENKILYSYLSLMSNGTVNTSFDVMCIHNTLETEEEQGFPIPKWAKPIWPETFLNACLQFWVDIIEQNLPDLIGNLLHKIVEDSKGKVGAYTPQKLFLYSGHDLNVVGALGALDAYYKEKIKYCAFVSFELHEIDEEYGFKVYGYNHDTFLPYLIPVPNCGTFCPIQKFETEIVKKLYKGDAWCKARPNILVNKATASDAVNVHYKKN